MYLGRSTPFFYSRTVVLEPPLHNSIFDFGRWPDFYRFGIFSTKFSTMVLWYKSVHACALLMIKYYL
eukprot:SAG11_NODE_633_length_8047_cov_33.422874_3_plen_67_part_00